MLPVNQWTLKLT